MGLYVGAASGGAAPQPFQTAVRHFSLERIMEILYTYSGLMERMFQRRENEGVCNRRTHRELFS
jgi:hypothetical protein